MSTRIAQAGTFPRRLLVVAAVVAIALSLALAWRAPVQAADPTLDIHQDLPIDSSTFKEDPDCGDATSGVVWHFVLVNYDGDDAQLFGEFADAGTFGPINPSDKPSASIHFYVTTPDDDSLIDAYVELEGTIADNTQLQLSHVCHAGETEQSVEASVAESVPASAEQSEKAGEGTPEGSQGDTSALFNGSGPLATIAFSLILLASLGTLAYANVKSVRSRNQ